MAGLKNLKKSRRIQIILVAFVALGLSTALIGYAMRDGINYFRSPSQVMTDPPRDGEVFRIGGLVTVDSLKQGTDGSVAFSVTDSNATVPVLYKGVLPDLFAEGAGMVGLGQMEGPTFVASEILAKHDESYMPKEVMEALKAQGVYKDPKAPGS
jgi:cytochrome c-type biogenesis protein CcmE